MRHGEQEEGGEMVRNVVLSMGVKRRSMGSTGGAERKRGRLTGDGADPRHG
jgi:hypothetical protein